MMTRNMTRFALPIFAAAMLSLAPAAFAQTSTMSSSSSMKMAPAKPTAKPSMMAPAGSYTSLADAQAKCTGDTVVWSTKSSKAYHTSSSKYFGKTKKGAYMCEKAASAAGYHAAKN